MGHFKITLFMMIGGCRHTNLCGYNASFDSQYSSYRAQYSSRTIATAWAMRRTLLTQFYRKQLHVIRTCNDNVGACAASPALITCNLSIFGRTLIAAHRVTRIEHELHLQATAVVSRS